MPLVELALGFVSKSVGSALSGVFHLLKNGKKRPLSVRLEPFDNQHVLRAFDTRLTNVSGDALRLGDIYIRQPDGSQLAIRWAPLMFILEDGPQYDPWELHTRYNLNHVLEPGETYHCEVGLPQGFAISASRQTPVKIAIEMTTFGERERKITQEIKRWISPK